MEIIGFDYSKPGELGESPRTNFYLKIKVCESFHKKGKIMATIKEIRKELQQAIIDYNFTEITLVTDPDRSYGIGVHGQTIYLPALQSYEGLLSFTPGRKNNLEKVDCRRLSFDGVFNLKNMFQGCTKLVSVKFGKHIKTSERLNISGMFMNCYSLRAINLSTFKTEVLEAETPFSWQLNEVHLPNFTKLVSAEHTFLSVHIRNVYFNNRVEIGGGSFYDWFYSEKGKEPVSDGWAVEATFHFPADVWKQIPERYYDTKNLDKMTIIVEERWINI